MHGFDFHEKSIEQARKHAKEHNVSNIRFQTQEAKELPGKYDLITMFDCLHDMGDPSGAAKHVHQSLKSNGTWMIVEPYSNERVDENLNPIGRVFYNASSMICVPASLSQEVGLAVGAQAGDSKLREIAFAGGFRQFKRATQTPFNRILEARP